MNILDIISKKKNNLELSKEEIYWLVDNYNLGKIPDYQMSAFLMAIYFQGMTIAEITNLTLSISKSGETLDLSQIDGVIVDKHSTGGVGDKTTLIVAPLVASLGGKVAKLSGRGLGHTGGTLDKLDSIKGFSTQIEPNTFIRLVNETNIALAGQTKDLAPADKKLYALRDVTSTVDSIPLIASSIMSKKLASGADAIVLDIKVGSGAFMKTEQDANKLAEYMVQIGKGAGKKTVAVISDMDQPLGYKIGNSLELEEVIETLNGNGPKDLVELSIKLAAEMLILSGQYTDRVELNNKLEAELSDGSAFEKFKELISNQGGDLSQINDPELLPKAKRRIKVLSAQAGYIGKIESETIGLIAMKLGAGRLATTDQIDHSVGIVLNKKIGDCVSNGELLAIAYFNNELAVESIESDIANAFQIGENKVSVKLIKNIID